jgi:hypothetical protein
MSAFPEPIRSLFHFGRRASQRLTADARVPVAVGLSRVRTGRCYACGSSVGPALLELGSTVCFECTHIRAVHTGSQAER